MPFSIADPLADFERTVEPTAHVLEYVRTLCTFAALYTLPARAFTGRWRPFPSGRIAPPPAKVTAATYPDRRDSYPSFFNRARQSQSRIQNMFALDVFDLSIRIEREADSGLKTRNSSVLKLSVVVPSIDSDSNLRNSDNRRDSLSL